jgi:hypothetical protein
MARYTEVHMQDIILSYGPPPLTQSAADAALDTIDFIAAAVRGYDAIDVTDVVRPIWRAHLAYYYLSLPFEMRNWYANAPYMLASINAQWPLLDPMQRNMFLQQWSVELPYMLWMLDPVLAEAQSLDLHPDTRARIDVTRQQAAPAPDNSGAAINELNRQSQIASSLGRFNTTQTFNTITLMHSMNGH